MLCVSTSTSASQNDSSSQAFLSGPGPTGRGLGLGLGKVSYLGNVLSGDFVRSVATWKVLRENFKGACLPKEDWYCEGHHTHWFHCYQL